MAAVVLGLREAGLDARYRSPSVSDPGAPGGGFVALVRLDSFPDRARAKPGKHSSTLEPMSDKVVQGADAYQNAAPHTHRSNLVQPNQAAQRGLG